MPHAITPSDVNILYVTDEVSGFESVRADIESGQGIHMTGLFDPEEALEQIVLGDFDMVIWDMRNPDKEILNAARRLVLTPPKKVFLMICPRDDRDCTRKAQVNGVMSVQDRESLSPHWIRCIISEICHDCPEGKEHCPEITLYKSILHRLDAGYALMELILDEGGDPTDFRIIDVNQEWRRLRGLEETDVTGRLASSSLPTFQDEPLKSYAKAAVEGELLTLRRAEGHCRPCQETVFSPRPGLFVSILHEYKGRPPKESSCELLMRNTTDVAGNMDDKGRLLRVNDRLQEMLGPGWRSGRTELVGLMHPEDRRPFIEQMGWVVSDVEKVNGRYRIASIDGSFHLIDMNLWKEDGGVFFIGSDVTRSTQEKKAIENGVVISDYLLQRSEDIDYKRLCDIALDLSGARYAIFNLYEEGGDDFVTKAISVRGKGSEGKDVCIIGRSDSDPDIERASRLLGYDLIGRRWNMDPDVEEVAGGRTVTVFPSLEGLLGTRIDPKSLRLVEKIFRMGESVLVRVDNKNVMLGDFLLIMPVGKSVQNKEMLSIYAHQVGTLIMRIMAERSSAIANRKLKLLTDVTRHDILNQLTAIRGYLELSGSTSDEGNRKRYLDKALESADVIQEFFDFTRQYEEIGRSQASMMPLKGLLAHALKDTPLEVDEDIPDVLLMTDPIMEKVFYNLMDNTVRHGDHANRINVRTKEDGEGLVIIWEDDGQGVDEDVKEMIFQQGFGKNTGFGLHLTREVLDLMGMSIRETGVPGKGARFEITVPKGKWSRDT